MAEIFLARSSGIGGFEKLVVIKRILPQHADNEEFVRMFLDEARLAATLNHPNIAQVYDIDCEAGTYFFTMEYVRGEDVRTILKRLGRRGQRLPLDHAVAIARAVAAGLHHAHEKRGVGGKPLGIVHRDVSPSNVLVTYDGTVKLVDFGIAKASARTTDTRVGTLKGKISYMSPEQCMGEPIDRRSDIFSLGILLYEMTTGVRPFEADTEYAILRRIVDGEALPPTAVAPEYPRDLERIVMRALARLPPNRYATAEQLQLDLDAFARESRLSQSPVDLGRFMAALFGEARAAGASLLPIGSDADISGVLDVSRPEPRPSSPPPVEPDTRAEPLPPSRGRIAGRRIARRLALGAAVLGVGAALVMSALGLRRAAFRSTHDDPEAAIARLAEAWRRERRPDALFAWAEAERQSGDCFSALVLYRRVLGDAPASPLALAARHGIQRCERALASQPEFSLPATLAEGLRELTGWLRNDDPGLGKGGECEPATSSRRSRVPTRASR